MATKKIEAAKGADPRQGKTYIKGGRLCTVDYKGESPAKGMPEQGAIVRAIDRAAPTVWNVQFGKKAASIKSKFLTAVGA